MKASELTTENGLTSYSVELNEAFLRAVNSPPPKKEVKVNKHAGNSNYLPISFVQMKLDEMFFGLWSWTVSEVRVIANEVLVWGTLEVFHPSAKVWLKRSGCGAAMILQSKGAQVDDISAKIKNTLVKDFPHAEAEALKSAAKKLGKAFGRDLNRQFEDEYTSFFETMQEVKEVEVDVDAQLENCRNLAELQEFGRQNMKLLQNDVILGKFTARRKHLENQAK
jgi:uncharacterized protein YukE